MLNTCTGPDGVSRQTRPTPLPAIQSPCHTASGGPPAEKQWNLRAGSRAYVAAEHDLQEMLRSLGCKPLGWGKDCMKQPCMTQQCLSSWDPDLKCILLLRQVFVYSHKEVTFHRLGSYMQTTRHQSRTHRVYRIGQQLRISSSPPRKLLCMYCACFKVPWAAVALRCLMSSLTKTSCRMTTSTSLLRISSAINLPVQHHFVYDDFINVVLRICELALASMRDSSKLRQTA